MSKDDYEAACDLASDMNWVDAAKFLRAELGFDLRQAAHLAEHIAIERPGTLIHKSFFRKD